MSRNSWLITLAAVGLSACGSETTGPQASLCSVRNGIEVCVQRAEYRQSDVVAFTTRNTTGVPIYRDGCSTKLVGKTSRDAEFEEDFEPSLRCGPGATAADVVANMIEMAPGESLEDSLKLISFAFQGFYRVNVWLLDADGALAADTPAFSGTFLVFPSAN